MGLESEDSKVFSDLTSVYCMLRTFSWKRRISPFSLKAFACGLASGRPCKLVDEVHVSLLRLLLLDALPDERASFPIHVSFLDYLTWPEFVFQYLEFKHEQGLQRKRAAAIGNNKMAVDPLWDAEEEKPEVNDPLLGYKFHVVERGEAERDSLASFKRENLNKHVTWGLKLTLDVVDNEADKGQDEDQAAEEKQGETAASDWGIKLDVDWGKDLDEKVKKIRELFKTGLSAEEILSIKNQEEDQQDPLESNDDPESSGRKRTCRSSKEYHQLDLQGKVSILQRLCDDLLDSSLLRCELYQREEYGLRTVLRFTTLLHTLNAKVEQGGPGRKSLSSQFVPTAPHLLQTPKKRGRPPKWASELQNSGKRRGKIHGNYTPKTPGRKGRKQASYTDDDDYEEGDHNVDACVLCGMGGNLLCCDGCPAAFHVKCAGETNKVISAEGSWLCEECKMLEENGGDFSDSLHQDLMRLKKCTYAPRTGARTMTWQIQNFAFQCRVLDTEIQCPTIKPRSKSRRRSKSKKDTGPKFYVGSDAPLSCEWTCKVLPTSHPIKNRNDAAEYLADEDFGEYIELEYFSSSLDYYVNKYRHSWNALTNEMNLRTKSRSSSKGHFTVSKYIWEKRIGRGQKSLQKLPLCMQHPSAYMLIVYLSKTEKQLWGLLEEKWSDYPTWRSKWIHSVFHAKSANELGLRLLELEGALIKRARHPSWFHASDLKLLSNRMREDPEQEIRSVQKKISLKVEEHKVGEYIDVPNMFKPVHPLRPNQQKPWPCQHVPTTTPMFIWRKNKSFLGRTPSLPRKEFKKIARQGGVRAAPGCLYPNKGYGVLSKQQAWRIKAESVDTISELALLIRDFNASLKWNEIQLLNEEDVGLKLISCRAVEPDSDDEEGHVEYLCSRGPSSSAPVSEAEWLPSDEIPLKLLKDFMEVHRLENIKSDRYFLRREHLHPALTGMDVAVYWPEEGRWYGAKLIVLPKDRGGKLIYPSGDQEILDKLSFEQALINQEISVDHATLKDRLGNAKSKAFIEKQMRIERDMRINAERLAREQREREKEMAKNKTILTKKDLVRLKLVNKAILDACVRISVGKDTSKGKKSKEYVASLIPRNVLNVLLERAAKGELKSFCMEKNEENEDEMQPVPVVGIPDKSHATSHKSVKDMAKTSKNAAVAVPKKVLDVPDWSAMTRENTEKCQNLIDRMCELKSKKAEMGNLATAFLSLPSRKALPQYYRVISAPVDIGSIRQALKRTKQRNYLVVQDFISDVELMFSNAKVYNQDSSVIYKNAETLRKWFWEQIRTQFPYITETNWKGETSVELERQGKLTFRDEIPESSRAAIPKVNEPKPKQPPMKIKVDFGKKTPKAPEPEILPPEPPKEKSLKEKMLIALSVVRDVMKLPESYPFHDPVDTTVFPVYAEIVKNPMDLGTIRKQLEAGRQVGWENLSYSSEEEVLKDVKLVWKNCRLFNRAGDPVYEQSVLIEPVFDTLWDLRMTCKDGTRYHIASSKPEIVLKHPNKCKNFRVGVWWPRSYCFFYGTIVSYEKNEKHKIHYDDDQFQSVTLLKHQIHWIDDRFRFKYSCSSSDGKLIEAKVLFGKKKPAVKKRSLEKLEKTQKKQKKQKTEKTEKKDKDKKKDKRKGGKKGQQKPDKPPKKEAAIGYTVRVFWPPTMSYYYGVVYGYDAESKKHTILYDDGTLESLNLSRTAVEWVEGSVGKRVGIWWKDDKTFYYGKIIDYNEEEKKHQIHYDDDAKEFLDLSKEAVDWKGGLGGNGGARVK